MIFLISLQVWTAWLRKARLVWQWRCFEVYFNSTPILFLSIFDMPMQAEEQEESRDNFLRGQDAWVTWIWVDQCVFWIAAWFANCLGYRQELVKNSSQRPGFWRSTWHCHWFVTNRKVWRHQWTPRSAAQQAFYMRVFSLQETIEENNMFDCLWTGLSFVQYPFFCTLCDLSEAIETALFEHRKCLTWKKVALDFDSISDKPRIL